VAIKGFLMPNDRFVVRFSAAAGLGALAFCGALALNLSTRAQQPAPTQQPGAAQPAQGATPDAAQAPASAPDGAQQPAPPSPAQEPAAPAPAVESPVAAKPAAAQSAKSAPPKAGEITEDELKRQLLGKPLYLRGGYLDSSLTFNEHGALIGHSPQGSFTLNAIEINRVRLAKHKLELEGTRYGLHFLGALPNEDPTKAMDRVKITPNKKEVRITIDRELVVSPRKGGSPGKVLFWKHGKQEGPDAGLGVPAKAAPTAAPPAQPAAAPAAQPDEMSEADQAKAEIAAAPPAERPADPASVTTTLSPAHAAGVLRDALDRIFAPGIDERLKASMPAFWRLYYQAAAAGADYRPSDPAVLRQNTVDKKARLITTFEPESNEYAQAHAVAGMALYHTVIGADGKPAEIAVARPIGFGLDENAVAAIRKATFEPAIKDGKPVPVLLDLVVQFRIYSKRTAVRTDANKPAEDTSEPSLPGPYSVQRP
jgi:outer membrane biosynthesis protein TonB